jgi:hypothetical protein
MDNLAKLLTSLAALAFLLAVVANFTGPILNTVSEGFSRACTNLGLLAIAFAISFGNRRPGVVGSETPR